MIMVENDLDELLTTARTVEKQTRDNPEVEISVAPEGGDRMGAMDPASDEKNKAER